MEPMDLHSKTKDELIDIINQLTKTKDSNITQEASNKRKREANVWSSHAGHTECSPLEIDANINSDSSLSSSKLRGSFKFSVEDHLRLAKVLVDEMYQFCALLDDNGHVLLANTPSLRGAGLRQEDIAGVPLWETRWWQVSPEHQARIRQSIKEVKSGKFIRFETLVYGQADGRSTIWIDFSMSAVYEDHDNERVLRYILVEGRNISDKKKAEEAVERKNEELRRLYEKVTELDELKSQFFANVSHELRTPLTLILGPVQRMLADGNLPERDLKDLEVVKRNTQTLLKHVNDLLDVSKIEAKKLEMNVERIDLEKLLKLVCSNFDALAQERNIQYTVNCTNPINLGNFLVELDSDKVQRIVLNLLSNAFKFTPVGGIINVQLLVEKRNDKMIAKLIMSDNGPGVPANLRKIIFERFRQGEGATNRKFGGTGLGLAIAKEFVEMHQGDIFVEESEFRGAKFVVELPMIQANLEVAKQQVPVKLSETMTANTIADLTGNMMTADKVQNLSNNILLAAQPSAMVVENSNSTPSLHQATILVVEDNIDMGNFISDSLSSNYRIMRAYNGVQGLEVISQRKPDIILSDVMMPYMSGDVMVQHIRSQRELDTIPIILLTAKADDNLKVHSLKGGVQDFLNKPFSIEELKARVENLVSVKLAVEALQSDLESKERNLVELTNQLLAKRRELQKMLEIAEKARAEAERLNTVKDEFLMTLSHELRTPLTGIIGWVSLIKDEITSDEMDANEVKRGLEIIEQCSEAETRVITDILDLSDIIAGRLKLTRNSINVGQLVDSGLDALTVAACAKNINIRKYDTPNFRSDLALMGDFDRLTQVVYNLVSNAVKFTSQGGHIEVGAEYCSDIHVTPSPTLVSTHKTSIEGPAVVIRVKDDGVGISQENLDKLFCRFGQLDSSSTRTYSGLGLGLALCRHIVELHGGFITVQSSSPTAGTVVSVYFPLAPVSSAAPVVELRSKTLQAARSAKILNGMKCLVVEPEKPSQLLLETIFRRDGASVECVNGTENALNVVNMTGMPNLVIINVDKVPKEDTLWLMKTLRVMKSGIAFLGLVSEFHSQEMQELIKAGIDFLRKPFKPYEVVSTAVFILSRVPKLQ